MIKTKSIFQTHGKGIANYGCTGGQSFNLSALFFFATAENSSGDGNRGLSMLRFFLCSFTQILVDNVISQCYTVYSSTIYRTKSIRKGAD